MNCKLISLPLAVAIAILPLSGCTAPANNMRAPEHSSRTAPSSKGLQAPFTTQASYTPSSEMGEVVELRVSDELHDSNEPEVENVEDVSKIDVAGLISGKKKPPKPEVLKAQLREQGNSFIYGYGLGTTILNVGTAIVFPPYALFLLGNAGLELAGFQRMDVTKALPPEVSKPVNTAYDEFVAIPGRLTSAIARERFREKEIQDKVALEGDFSSEEQMKTNLEF